MSHPGPKKSLKLLSASNNSNAHISSLNGGGILNNYGSLGGAGVTKGICLSGDVSSNTTPKSN